MIPYISDKARKATFATFKKYSSLGILPPKTACKLFDSNVSPVLNYAAELWGSYKEIQQIETVHYRFLKYTLGVKDSTSNLATLGEFGRFPMCITHSSKIIKYWSRLLKLDKNKLVKKAYNTLYSLHNSGFQTWVSQIEQILNINNLQKFWVDQLPLDDHDLKNLNISLQVKFTQNWEENIDKFPILRFYKKFKTNFVIEPYLYLIKDNKLRKTLSKFRLSSHSLKIETGRHTKPKTPLEKRTCTLCNFNAIESEEHLLLHCPLYQEERIYLFSKIISHGVHIENNSNPNSVLISLMSSNNSDILFNLCKFLDKAFKARSLLL